MPESSEGIQPAPIKETVAKPEKLIGPESAGAQALMLLGIKPPEKGNPLPSVNKEELQRIANEGLSSEHKNKIFTGSLNERDEYWKEKGVNEEERMGVWTRQLDGFINKYKNDPKMAEQSEFLKRILRTDSLEKVNATSIYETFMQGEGRGDVEFYARRIVETNSQEQIEQNSDLLEKLGKIFGDNSAKISGLLAYGIANGRRNPGEFATLADSQFKKGDYGDREVWDKLDKNNQGWSGKEAVRQAEVRKKEEEDKERQKAVEEEIAKENEARGQSEEQKDTQEAGAEMAESEGDATKPSGEEDKSARKREIKTPEELRMEIGYYLADTSTKINSYTDKLRPFLNTIRSNLTYVKDAEYLLLAGNILEEFKQIDKTPVIEKNELLAKLANIHAQLYLGAFTNKDDNIRKAFRETGTSLKLLLEGEKVEFTDLAGQKFDPQKFELHKIQGIPIVVDDEAQKGKILNGLQYSANGELLTAAMFIGVTKEEMSQIQEQKPQ